MRFKVLDSKTVNGHPWILCKSNLYDYLAGLKDDFFEFSVQRKIVNNIYLDSIDTSVEKGEPFPVITLTYQGNLQQYMNTEGQIEIGKSISLDEQQVEILDGLQRTYRLWIIYYLHILIHDKGCTDMMSVLDELKKTGDGEVILQNNFFTPKYLRALLEQSGGGMHIDSLVEKFKIFEVYFFIWSGLDDNEVIRQMLVLNAGQKSVSSTHQFELLFLHFFEKEKLNIQRPVTLLREKDPRYRKVQRGDRSVGEYSMASVVIALQSFINGRQLRIHTVNKINLDDDKLLNEKSLSNYFNAQVLSEFINILYDFDELLSSKLALYIKWFGRDTTLSGVFGAFGRFMMDKGEEVKVSYISRLLVEIIPLQDPFKLNEYYDAYDNKLASTKVNVGNAVRKAIFNYTYDMLTLGKTDWYTYFDTVGRHDEV